MTLDERLRNEENSLQWLTRRLFALEEVFSKLDESTKGKAFRIWNAPLWTMVIDSRDMHVTHFASWARSMFQKGGLFKQVQAHHLRDFKRSEHPTAFARLFPNATGNAPQPSDLKSLCDHFVERVEILVADRDANRAHLYERKTRGRAKFLKPAELRTLTTEIEGLLNDLRRVACHSELGYHDHNDTPVDEAAIYAVDGILLGPRSRIRAGRAKADRDALYAQLHRAHEKVSASGPPFNFKAL
jgi:hypothetical protein